ncbi:MAG: hypothetical protein AAFQ87_24380 [Bacteroidota bacterium]
MKHLTFVLASCLIVLTACRPEPVPPELDMDDLIGTWRVTSNYEISENDGPEETIGTLEYVMEIREDQRVWFPDDMSQDSIIGEWVVDDNDLFLEFLEPALDSNFVLTAMYKVGVVSAADDFVELEASSAQIVRNRRFSINKELDLVRIP